MATRSRLRPVRTCPFPLARACAGMHVCVCVCVQVGVLRMTPTARAAGQRARPNAAGTLSTHGGTPVPTAPTPVGQVRVCLGARASACATVRVCPRACVGACARVRVRARVECVRVCVCVCVCVSVCVRSCRRVCVLTPPPNHPPATSRVACCNGHGPLQPLVARCLLRTAARVVVLFVAAPFRCAADSTAAVAAPLWARGTLRVLHAARRLRI